VPLAMAQQARKRSLNIDEALWELEKKARCIVKSEYLAWKKKREKQLGRPMTFKELDTELYTSRTPPWEKRAYKLQGKTEVQGIPISIENRKGSVRKGTDSDGNEWKTKMLLPYGYVRGTRGADGEPVDAYVGPDKEAPDAYVVHQRDKETGKYDEDKIFFGMKSKKDVKEAFLKHYDSPKFLGPISRVPVERLKELITSKRRLVKISAAKDQKNKALHFARKAGPGLGGLAGLGIGAVLGARRGKLLKGAIAGLGTGATLGWVPDMAANAREAIRKVSK